MEKVLKPARHYLHSAAKEMKFKFDNPRTQKTKESQAFAALRWVRFSCLRPDGLNCFSARAPRSRPYLSILSSLIMPRKKLNTERLYICYAPRSLYFFCVPVEKLEASLGVPPSGEVRSRIEKHTNQHPTLPPFPHIIIPHLIILTNHHTEIEILHLPLSAWPVGLCSMLVFGDRRCTPSHLTLVSRVMPCSLLGSRSRSASGYSRISRFRPRSASATVRSKGLHEHPQSSSTWRDSLQRRAREGGV